jgi:hypothetical protein
VVFPRRTSAVDVVGRGPVEETANCPVNVPDAMVKSPELELKVRRVEQVALPAAVAKRTWPPKAVSETEDVTNLFPVASTGAERNWMLPLAVSPVVETFVAVRLVKVGFMVKPMIAVPVAEGPETVTRDPDVLRVMIGWEEVE